jgi:hypothetical protein
MALSATKFHLTVQAMARGGASGTGLLLNADTLKMALMTTAPKVATDADYNTTATEVGNGNGYTTGGVSLTGATSNSSGTETLKTTADFASPTWTASSSGFTLRYFIFYDSTASGAVTQNLATWDYGGNLVLSGANGDTLDLSSSNFDSTGWATLA